MNAASMVDLTRYPIANLDSPEGAAFAARCRQQYLDEGLCMLPQFILPEALEALAEESNALTPKAYFFRSTHNAYLTEDDPELPADTVARRQEHTYVGSVAFDQIGRESRLRSLYFWDPLKDFIGSVLGKSEFHRFADPLGACSINVFVDGGEHGWHFDESEFTVTLMLQSPEQGGDFEFVPLIRGTGDEETVVANVLSGDRSGVMRLPFSAGTLLVFGGSQTLHRVTRVTGDRPRLVPVLCYSEKPGLENSETVQRMFWGRTASPAARVS